MLWIWHLYNHPVWCFSFSRKVIWLEVGPTNNNPDVVGKFFLDAVRAANGKVHYIMSCIQTATLNKVICHVKCNAIKHKYIHKCNITQYVELYLCELANHTVCCFVSHGGFVLHDLTCWCGCVRDITNAYLRDNLTSIGEYCHRPTYTWVVRYCILWLTRMGMNFIYLAEFTQFLSQSISLITSH